jgi:hypothetical protein
MVYSTHGLFLTCTQSFVIFTQCTINWYLHNIHAIVNCTLCKNNKEPQLTWRASFLLMVANSHPLWSLAWWQLPHPLTLAHSTPSPPPQPTLHYLKQRHQQSRSSSSGTLWALDNPVKETSKGNATSVNLSSSHLPTDFVFYRFLAGLLIALAPPCRSK